MLQTEIGRLRLVALIEGVSYMVLLLIAMPLKYMAGIPIAVKLVGSIHGFLFMAFCLALVQAMIAAKWPLVWSIKVFVSSIIPMGTFYMDGKLKEEDERFRTEQATEAKPSS